MEEQHFCFKKPFKIYTDTVTELLIVKKYTVYVETSFTYNIT